MVPSAFDDMVESVRAALNAKRSEVAERIATIEGALRGYERALEFEIADSFATEHGLKHPARQVRPAEAALKLSLAVASLPELVPRTKPHKDSPEPDPEPESEREAAVTPRARPHGGKNPAPCQPSSRRTQSSSTLNATACTRSATCRSGSARAASAAW
jgi:hypothetical protein